MPHDQPPLAATAGSLHSNQDPAQPEASKSMRFQKQTKPQGLVHTRQEQVCLLLEEKGEGRGRKAELEPAGTGTEREGNTSQTVLSLACLRAFRTGQGLRRETRAAGPSAGGRDALREHARRSGHLCRLLISSQVLRQGFLRAGAARQRPSTPSARSGFTRPRGRQPASA